MRDIDGETLSERCASFFSDKRFRGSRAPKRCAPPTPEQKARQLFARAWVRAIQEDRIRTGVVAVTKLRDSVPPPTRTDNPYGAGWRCAVYEVGANPFDYGSRQWHEFERGYANGIKARPLLIA